MPVALIAAPAAALLAGALTALAAAPGPRPRSGFQHFAAGVVFAAVALELLPQLQGRSRLLLAIGFSVGTATMIGLREGAERWSASRSPLPLVVAVAVDVAIDGTVLGTAVAGGSGQLISLGLIVELLFLGLSLVIGLTGAGVGRAGAVGAAAAVAALLAGSAAATWQAAATSSPAARELLVSFGTAALLYLVVEELLVEAHEVADTPLVAGAFFIGFLALLLVGGGV